MNILFLPGGYSNSQPVAHVKGVLYHFPREHNVIAISPLEWNLKNCANVRVIKVCLSADNIFKKFITIIKIIYFGLRVAKKNKIDIIYARDGIGSLAGFVISKLRKIPYAIEINGIITDTNEMKIWMYDSKILFSVVRTLVDIVLKKTYKDALILFVCTSGNLKDEIQNRYQLPDNKMKVVSNAADPAIFKPLELRETQKYLNLKKGNYILYSGYLDSCHGIDIFVKAAPIVIDEFPDSHFIVLGDGPQKHDLVKLAKMLNVENHFSFFGRVPFESVSYYINASDICVACFAFNYRNKNAGLSPLKLFEYMSCGKPVICNRFTGLDNYICESKAGILVNPDDHLDLAEAIIQLLRNEELRMKMGKNGRECILNKYNWSNVCRTICEQCEYFLTKIS